MIEKLKAFGWFWYDFIVGDDWLLAAGVATLLVASWLTLRVAEDAAWLLLTIGTLVVLYASVRRAAK